MIPVPVLVARLEHELETVSLCVQAGTDPTPWVEQSKTLAAQIREAL